MVVRGLEGQGGFPSAAYLTGFKLQLLRLLLGILGAQTFMQQMFKLL